VFKLRSVNNIVIADAKTGKDKINKNTVINTLHTNNAIFSNLIPKVRIFKIVTKKFIELKIEEIPAICKEKIAKSTD
jgi:hypothetical protein